MKSRESFLVVISIFLFIALIVAFGFLIRLYHILPVESATEPVEGISSESLSSEANENQSSNGTVPVAIDANGYAITSSEYMHQLIKILNAGYRKSFAFNLDAVLKEEELHDDIALYEVEVGGRSFLFTFTNAAGNVNFSENDQDDLFDLVTVMETVQDEDALYILVGISEAMIMLSDSNINNHDDAFAFVKDLLDDNGKWVQHTPMEYSMNIITAEDGETSVILFTVREISAFSSK